MYLIQIIPDSNGDEDSACYPHPTPLPPTHPHPSRRRPGPRRPFADCQSVSDTAAIANTRSESTVSMGRSTRLQLPSTLQASSSVPLFALLLLHVSSALGASKSYDGWRVLRVAPASAEHLQLLELQVRGLGPDAGEVWRRGSSADVLLHPDALHDVQSFLDDNGIPSLVHVHDLGEEIRQERGVDTSVPSLRIPDPLNAYLHSPEINKYLENLSQQNPEFVRVKTFGESYEGRPLKVIEISRDSHAQRPVILVDAGIHAREWIAPAMALYIIQQLVENPAHQNLSESVDWHIMPLLNPDGYEFSHKSDRMWRKTRSRTYNPVCFGVDPNRNFDIHWSALGASWDPCKETYAGPRPFSEPETAAVAKYALSLRGRLRLYVSVHSYGGVLIYPYGYTYYKPKDAPQMESLANTMAKAVKAAGIPDLVTGNLFESFGELASGGSDDWMKDVAGANFSYTLEMPVPTFTTPPSLIKNYVVPTFEAFRVVGTYIGDLFGKQ